MIDKIKKYGKKLMLCAVGSAMIFSSLTTSVYALTGTTSAIKRPDWKLAYPDTEVAEGTEGYLMVDVEPVFCVDYYATFRSGKKVTQGTFQDAGISEETAKRLSLIAYYGTKVAGRTDTDWYAITQGLMWRVIHNDDSLKYVRTNTTPNFASTQQAWNQILADVDRYYIAPSFVNDAIEVDADEVIELNDTNGVLSDMSVFSSGGLDVSIVGQKLVIKGASHLSDNVSIVLRKNVADAETGTSIVYTSPECQSVASFKVSDPMQVRFNVKVNKFGKLKLTKYNDDKSGTVPDTSYRITGPNGYDETHTTNSDGKIVLERLRPGNYNAVEVKAGDGYLINVQEFGFTIKPNETTAVDPSNIEPTGKVELTKEIDSSQTGGLTGNAYLKDNEFGLYAKEKITNKANTKTFYEKNELISKSKTGSDGKITWDNLPLGNYYIKELRSNDSLVLNKDIIDVELKYKDQTVSKVIEKKNTSNKVNMQKIQVFKSGEKDGISGLVKGLQGAEFTFRLKSEVDHVGWDNANNYAVITTDENGKANTPYLPYGTYLVKETKTPKDYITAPDFTVSVTDDYSEYTDVEQVKRVNVNNRPFTSQLKIVKVDKETGKTVTLNSAEFKIRDSKGNYIVQKVGGKKYDTFTTNSKNQITVLFGNKGEVTLPLQLDAGSYMIEEVKIPDGFLELEEPLKFTISNVHDYDKDDDEDSILVVKVANSQPKGKITLQKTDKETGKALADVEYVLTAKNTIYDKVDGSVRFEKDAIVAKGVTDADGKIVIDGLFIGEYQLRETLTNEGYVLSSKVHDIVFGQKDTSTKEYTFDIDVTNIAPEGEIHLVKTDKDTNELLSGVIFELTAKEDIYSLDGRKTLLYNKGDKVSVDISEDGLYMTNELGEIHIAGLPLGHYELKEVKTLDGYVPNQEKYDFDLSYNFTEQLVYSTDLNIKNVKSTAEISKVDATDSKELEGAHLSLFDKEGNLVEDWVSGKEPHTIRGLLIDHEYRLHEDLAPLGYATASDITFTVKSDGTVTKVVMKDEITKVDISKVDATTGDEIAGAKMSLTDKETGEIVESWISQNEPHRINGLVAGKTYVLHEESAPDGYLVAEDVEFTVSDSGAVQKVIMKDERKPAIVKTGDDIDIYTISVLAGASALLIVALIVRIRSKQNEKK